MTILFDLDGTLIDSTEAILESFGVAFKSFDKPIPKDELIKAEIGYPLDKMFSTLGVESSDVDSFVLAYKEHYRKISCQKTTLLKDAKDAVELASKYAMLGVVTTKTAKYSIELLEHMDMMKYFDILIGREDVINPKPHPEPIQKAMTGLSVSIDDCWMIGDTPMDIESANRANIKSVAVTCGYGTEESLKKYTDNIYVSSYEAVKFIVN